jgi:hypothetical protein
MPDCGKSPCIAGAGLTARTPLAFPALLRIRRLLFSSRLIEGKSMRTAAALAFLAVAIAGCGKGAGNGQNAAGTAGLPLPGARPEASASSDQAYRQRYREANIGTCTTSGEARMAQLGAPAPASAVRNYCTCFIDGAIAGVPDDRLAGMQLGPREQAIADQCAREQGFSTDLSRSGGK